MGYRKVLQARGRLALLRRMSDFESRDGDWISFDEARQRILTDLEPLVLFGAGVAFATFTDRTVEQTSNMPRDEWFEFGTRFTGTFGGGVNEIQREIVATLGLHLPRAPR